MDTASFLKTVITTPEGWLDLLVGPPDRTGWHDEWFEWPKQLEDILERASKAALNNNVYFSAHLFGSRHSIKDNVLLSRTIQADLDDAMVPTINAPTVLVETSPNRHQGYWILRDSPSSPEALELLSRQLTYSIPDADRTGWSLGHKMRLPGTLNHKYSSGPKLVKVISAAQTIYRDLRLAPVHAVSINEDDEPFIPDAEALEGLSVRETWLKLRSKLPRKVVSQYDRTQEDRSAALWALMLALFRAGLNRHQVFFVAQASANNKFADNRYHADLDLIKDILRAERALKQGGGREDIKTLILEARKIPGLAADRKTYIAALVRDHMATAGTFMATTDGQEWYIREDTGRPVPLSRESDHLNSLLEIRYGLNATEAEQRYVVHNLISMTKERGQLGRVAHLSSFSDNRLLVHTGRRDVFQVDERSISVVANGNLGVVFPWRPNEDAFDPDLRHPVDLGLLFEGCFDNLEDLTPKQALALLRAWLIFMLFRDLSTGRPILALLGQPGSGKSTLFRRIYTFLYGAGKALNTITSSDDYDHAVANSPLVVFDGIDTWVNWLPDKLSLSAANSDLQKRKLYTDADTVVLKRQALVGISAHNPKFRREDIVDRMVMINFHRLTEFKPETPILQNIVLNRDGLWGQMLIEAQQVLKTPQPSEREVPAFRVNDFARIGLWIARALSFEQDFVSALATNASSQTAFNLEEEEVLVSALNEWLRGRSRSEFHSVSELWNGLTLTAPDPTSLIRFYRNAVGLGKKLFALQESLRTVFNIEYAHDDKGARLWKIERRSQ